VLGLGIFPKIFTHLCSNFCFFVLLLYNFTRALIPAKNNLLVFVLSFFGIACAVQPSATPAKISATIQKVYLFYPYKGEFPRTCGTNRMCLIGIEYLLEVRNETDTTLPFNFYSLFLDKKPLQMVAYHNRMRPKKDTDFIYLEHIHYTPILLAPHETYEIGIWITCYDPPPPPPPKETKSKKWRTVPIWGQIEFLDWYDTLKSYPLFYSDTLLNGELVQCSIAAPSPSLIPIFPY
jgi:hypothetical protein